MKITLAYLSLQFIKVYISFNSRIYTKSDTPHGARGMD